MGSGLAIFILAIFNLSSWPLRLVLLAWMLRGFTAECCSLLGIPWPIDVSVCGCGLDLWLAGGFRLFTWRPCQFLLRATLRHRSFGCGEFGLAIMVEVRWVAVKYANKCSCFATVGVYALHPRLKIKVVRVAAVSTLSVALCSVVLLYFVSEKALLLFDAICCSCC
ncbi:hypothetical protein U1Q18_033634 [Sarracenia purpurea var. burkii]